MKSIKVTIAISCLIAMLHEIFILLTMDITNPSGSVLTRLFIIGAIFLFAIHQYSRIFDSNFLDENHKIPRSALILSIIAVAAIYVLRFIAQPANVAVHRYAPVDAALAVIYCMYMLNALAGDAYLGKLRYLFRWRFN